MEDPIERNYEYSGIFVSDYLEGCKMQSISPFLISKVEPTDLSRTLSNSKLPVAKKNDSGDIASTEVANLRIASNDSKFRFTQKINVISNEDEVAGIQVRGWQIAFPMTDILVNSILASSTITLLCLWNCGLNDAQAHILLQLANSSNIRDLMIDQNPCISETLFAGFIGEDSNIKTLSVRSNDIGDAGAKAIAAALKVNRSLSILNLWDNRIGRDGAEAIADGLIGNPSLFSLSLGKNYVDDAAVISFAKILSNQILTTEEVQVRRKVIADWEKRRELEDKQKKGISPVVKPVGKGAKPDDTKDSKKPPAASAKGVKKPEAPKLPNPKPPSSPEKKSLADEKLKGKDLKKSIISSVPPPKGGRKQSVVEDADGAPTGICSPEPQPYADEPMYEIHGQWYILGNRSINNLDFSSNEITETGLNALSEAISIQEMTNEIASSTDGMMGLYKLSLYHNKFESDHPKLTALNHILNKRNPFYVEDEFLIENANSSVFENARLSEVSTSDKLRSSIAL